MGRPYVIVGGFMSVDGKTAPASRQGRLFIPLMNEKLLKRLHKLRAEVDGVLVGVSTILADNPKLTVRAVQGKNPLRIVLDSMAAIPLESEVLKVDDAPTIIAVCRNAPKERTDMLVEKGAEIMRFDCERYIPLGELLERLHCRGVRKLLVEGGSEVRWSFVRSRLVDELFVWITPSVWGGRDAPSLVGGEGCLESSCSLKLQIGRVEVEDSTVILEYKVARDSGAGVTLAPC
ncbi:dihydrofolate reductase family protein [Candidatus Bathyarchaeota archaeon]|nr:dihydrofolate reductase family protein [Candidatus Bathyarchaeota archaeon]